MGLPLDKLQGQILELASDNDGLWEFSFIGGQRRRDSADDSRIERVSANPNAFRDLHQPMIEMVRAGYITIRTASGDDLVRRSPSPCWAMRLTGFSLGNEAAAGLPRATHTG